MFNSTILDLAIGLVFTFLAVSLAAGAITETIASAIKWRSKTLRQGIKNLLNDASSKTMGQRIKELFKCGSSKTLCQRIKELRNHGSRSLSGYALDIYNHALVNPRADGTATTDRPPKKMPSYIDPQHFADALMDVIGITGKEGKNVMKQEVSKIQDKQLKRLLDGIVDRSAGNIENIRNELAGWFDGAMDRVSGAYKRWAQLISFFVALFLIVIPLNISAVHVTERLWKQPVDMAKISQIKSEDIAKTNVQDFMKSLGNLSPDIGWQGWNPFAKFWLEDLWTGATAFEAWTRIVGWLITALATLFGAPFWFDALQQIIRLKGSGPSPGEKKQNKAAAV